MRMFVNAAEFGRLVGVDRSTIARWIAKGRIKGARRAQGSLRWQIPITSYEELIKQSYENRNV